jgi:hypothetical protein
MIEPEEVELRITPVPPLALLMSVIITVESVIALSGRERIKKEKSDIKSVAIANLALVLKLCSIIAIRSLIMNITSINILAG